MIVIDDKFKADVGKRLRGLREGQGLTIDDVVARLSDEYYSNVDEKSIRRYEKGEFLPKIDNLLCLADLFNTTLDYIVYGKSTSDDNSFTKYDCFKRLNRLIYSLAIGFVKNTQDGKIYLELWEDIWKVYYERLQSFGVNQNYLFEYKNADPNFVVEDMDNLFLDFKSDEEQLAPTLERYNKYLRSKGYNPEEVLRRRIEEIKSKQGR